MKLRNKYNYCYIAACVQCCHRRRASPWQQTLSDRMPGSRGSGLAWLPAPRMEEPEVVVQDLEVEDLESVEQAREQAAVQAVSQAVEEAGTGKVEGERRRKLLVALTVVSVLLGLVLVVVGSVLLARYNVFLDFVTPRYTETAIFLLVMGILIIGISVVGETAF